MCGGGEWGEGRSREGGRKEEGRKEGGRREGRREEGGWEEKGKRRRRYDAGLQAGICPVTKLLSQITTNMHHCLARRLERTGSTAGVASLILV